MGLNINKLQLKRIDEFGGIDVSEEIKKLRYDHYINKIQQDLNEILYRRKEIIR